ncbi:hypothetical protein [Desulfitobacterium sp.]|uniref:hypothetical protein n=1 Tax=Desulfitobacterium sp. TaxID=49981 RepID=UPI002C5E8A6A|nr:hypothetical protein [Desulfitobacterium sp.]HVJ49861.1 hypothetical protein [Desulfitobacterium sp.]
MSNTVTTESRTSSITNTVTVKVKEVKSAIAFLAAGLGLLTVSILNLLQSLTGGAKGSVGTFLTLHQGIGPYSGKQVLSILVWVIAWVVLNKSLANKDLEPAKIMRWSYILIVVAGLLVFPPVIGLFV